MDTFGTTTDQKRQKFATAADVDAQLGVGQKGKVGDFSNQVKICGREVLLKETDVTEKLLLALYNSLLFDAC